MIVPSRLPLTAKNEFTLPDLGAQGDVLLRRTSGSLGGHLDCDPVILGVAVVVPQNVPLDQLSEFCWVRSRCPTRLGGKRQQKAGRGGFFTQALSTFVLGPTCRQYLELFLVPTKRIFLFSTLANRADDNLSNAVEVDNPKRWLPRMRRPVSLLPISEMVSSRVT